jgi:drug/metabolite transporter (DMT)-like permease
MNKLLSLLPTTIIKPWMISIYIAVLFFVFGQVLLKKSFINNTDYNAVAITFGISFGITATIFILFNQSTKSKLFNNPTMIPQLLCAIVAGILFFIGNFFWIRSISSNKPLGNIRVVMAGVETLALFAAGVLFFKEFITLRQLIGTTIIISGIHIFGAN